MSNVPQQREFPTGEKEVKKYTFDFTPTGTTITLKQEIIELQNLTGSKALYWLEQFKRITEQSKWDDSTSVAVFKNIVHEGIRNLIENKRALETILSTLLQAIYPPQDRSKYELQLGNLRQEKYRLIKDYTSAVQEAFQKYCTCANLKEKEQGLRHEEFWYNGLHLQTQLEMTRLNYETKEEITQSIQQLETRLLGIQEDINYKEIRENKVEGHQRQANTKFCRKHGNYFHSTKECRALKQNIQKNDQPTTLNKKDSSYILRIPEIREKDLIFNGSINSQPVKFQLDPGATISCISKSLIKKMKLKSEVLRNNKRIELANRTMVDSRK